MDTDDANYMRQLVGSLTNLAAEPEAQLAYLGACGPDELAEDHHAPACNAGWMCEEGLINARVRDVAEQIGATFKVMSGQQNVHRWSEEALVVDPGWIEIRAMAREALALLEQ